MVSHDVGVVCKMPDIQVLSWSPVRENLKGSDSSVDSAFSYNAAEENKEPCHRALWQSV